MEVNQENIGAVTDKINACSGKVDAVVEKGLNLVGDHPWEDWMKAFTGFASKFLPAVIAISGLAGFLAGLIISLQDDYARFSDVMGNLGTLVATVFSMHLASKALALPQSFISKNEPEAVRPELLYILKVLLGLGGIVMSVVLLLQFSSYMVRPAIYLAVLSLVTIVVLTRPALVGVKADYPKNAVEEFMTLAMLPLKTVLALLPFIVVVSSIYGCVYGLTLCFKGEYGIVAARSVFQAAAVVPLLLPLGVYVVYLVITFVLDLYRSLVSIPRKLDEVRQALENK